MDIYKLITEKISAWFGISRLLLIFTSIPIAMHVVSEVARRKRLYENPQVLESTSRFYHLPCGHRVSSIPGQAQGKYHVGLTRSHSFPSLPLVPEARQKTATTATTHEPQGPALCSLVPCLVVSLLSWLPSAVGPGDPSGWPESAERQRRGSAPRDD